MFFAFIFFHIELHQHSLKRELRGTINASRLSPKYQKSLFDASRFWMIRIKSLYRELESVVV